VHKYNTTEQTQPQSPSTEDSVRYLNTVWSGARSVQCASNGLDWWPLICRLWQQPRDSGPTLGSCRRNCTCGNEILVASPHNIDQVRLLTHTCSNQHASQHIHLGKQLKQLPKIFVYIINQGVTLQLIQTIDQVSNSLPSPIVKKFWKSDNSWWSYG